MVQPTPLIPDNRHIANGYEIPSESYSDQPYIVKTDDGAWLCVMTTAPGHEGENGQHIVTTRSHDQGRSWTTPVDVEPANGPESSYAVLLKIPSGRIYCFYNHNSDNLRRVKAAPESDWSTDGWCYRVDTLGYHVFKSSDDHGQSWSAARTALPIRTFAIDRENVYGGTIQFFWNVGKPFIHAGAVYISIHKVGNFGAGFMASSQGVLVKSDNLLTESDPVKIRWETLPDGDIGLRTPPGGGPVSDEQSYSVLSDGSFYCVYRTIDGHPVDTYSRDGGHTWSTPQYKRYANGQLMKHPRAANFAWRCQNGNYLYWFHNHGGRFIVEHPDRPTNAYQDRNPVWISGGVEVDSPEGKVIQWSQPEILLYDDDPWIRMSYPDLIEEAMTGEGNVDAGNPDAGWRYFISETQKDRARVHEIDSTLLAGLWGQFALTQQVATDALLLAMPKPDSAMPQQVEMPPLPHFTKRSRTRADYGTEDTRAGVTIDLWLQLDTLDAGQLLLDNRTAQGQGFCLQTTARGTVEILLNDGRTESRWNSDPGALQTGRRQHLVVVLDGGPKLVAFIIDGVLCDGGNDRQFGWGRFNPHLRHLNGDKLLHVGESVVGLRIYDRALRVSEAIGNYRKDSHA